MRVERRMHISRHQSVWAQNLKASARQKKCRDFTFSPWQPPEADLQTKKGVASPKQDKGFESKSSRTSCAAKMLIFCPFAVKDKTLLNQDHAVIKPKGASAKCYFRGVHISATRLLYIYWVFPKMILKVLHFISAKFLSCFFLQHKICHFNKGLKTVCHLAARIICQSIKCINTHLKMDVQ